MRGARFRKHDSSGCFNFLVKFFVTKIPGVRSRLLCRIFSSVIMNVNAVIKTPSESATWSSKPNKKSKKKKRRNKHKLYNLRLKKQKRKPNFMKLTPEPTLEFSSSEIMSNWYWSNYKKAVEWKNKHELAHWKACALALQEENRYLLQIINEMRPGMSPNVSVTRENLEKKRGRQGFNTPSASATSASGPSADNSVNAETHDDKEEEQGSDEDVEFEMSEEMIEFFKESMKHKANLKKLKEQESAKKVEEEVKQLQMSRLRRSMEMQLLYGEGASMIIGMETAVQLSYEKFCETKSPKYWPNIPFRL